jgi:hypothetical protein
MAPGKEGGCTPRKTSAGRSDSEHIGRTVEKGAGQVRDITMVNVDPWGSFFDMFLAQAAEGESASRHDDGPKPAKAVQTSGTKLGRQGRSLRAT